MQNRSLGLIETWGHIPAMEAADAACKAANVTLIGYETVDAGLVTVTFSGDVAAVKTAVSAGTAAAGRVGKVVSAHVIARPDRQLRSLSALSAPSTSKPPREPPPAAPQEPPQGSEETSTPTEVAAAQPDGSSSADEEKETTVNRAKTGDSKANKPKRSKRT